MRSTVYLAVLAAGLTLVGNEGVMAQSAGKPAAAAAKPTEAAATATKPNRAVIHASAAETMPVTVGEALPAMGPLKNAEGAPVSLADATKGKTSVIVLYRGGWCPYCVTHMAELARIQPDLAAQGVQLLAISPDSPATQKAFAAEHPLPYTLLSDSDHNAMKALGVAFALDAATIEKYKEYGIDLVKASGNPEQALPVSSVFVVNPEGKITYAHTNPDYKKRLSGDDVLKAAGIVGAPK